MLSNKSWDLSKYLVLLSLESEMWTANFLNKIFVYVYSTRVTAAANRSFFMYIYGCGEVLMGKQNNHLKY